MYLLTCLTQYVGEKVDEFRHRCKNYKDKPRKC